VLSICGVMGVSAASAFAAPETPEKEAVTAVTATTAKVSGVLNPNESSTGLEPGIYGFLFGVSAPGACGEEHLDYEEGGVLHQEAFGTAVGVKEEKVEADLTGLHPHSQYTFCLLERNESGEAKGAPVPFETESAPPSIVSESVAVKSTEARLEAVVDPNNEKTECHFQYGAASVSEHTVPCEQGNELEGGEQGVSLNVTGLTHGTAYRYRVLVKNATGKTEGKEEHFTTYTTPETPEASVERVFASVVTFHGVLAAKIASGTPSEVLDYEFVYRESKMECKGAGEVETTQGMSLGIGREEPSQQVTGLKPSTEYTVCLVAHNSSNLSEETPSSPVTFKTSAATKPEAPETTGVGERKATTATIEGVVNPHKEGEPGSDRFLYAQSANVCTGGAETAQEPTSGQIGGKLAVSIGGLEAGKPYTFCVEAFNALGEATLSAPKTFETAIPPETPTGVEAKPIGASAVTLLGTLNPNAKGEKGSYEFLYKQSATGCQGESQTPVSLASGAQGEPVTAQVNGLEPGKPYTFCLLARNEAGDHHQGELEEETALSGPVMFTTLLVAAPAIERYFVTDLASTSVTLHAQLNPEGAQTTYTFEYAPSGGEFKPVIEPQGHGQGTLPAGTTGVPVSVHVQQGLSANTSYQFRLVVQNSVEKVTSEPVTFTTQPSGLPFTLPDNRGYEMVTPVQKQGAEFLSSSGEGSAIRAAASGDAIADIASLPTELQPEGNADATVSVLSSRGSSGWSSRVIAAPHPVAGIARENQEEYITFAEDLSAAIVEPASPGFEQLSPQASEPTAYLHTLFNNGNVAEPCQAPYTSAASCYAPLAGPSDDSASPLQPFGELAASGLCENAGRCGPKVRAGTPDLSHLVLSSSVPLTVTKAPNAAANEPQPDLYEYSAGQLQLLSILPGHEEGSPHLQLAGRAGIGAAELGKGDVAARHAISNDGGRVILQERGPIIGELDGRPRFALYLRDVVKGETIRLDESASEPGTEASVEPEYMTADSEGSRIFFLDSAKLTANSGAYVDGKSESSKDRPDLYECAIVEENGKDHCTLTDLTPRTNGESARVAAVLGASEDGSYVYFAAAGGLGLAPSGACKVEAGEYGTVDGEEPPAGALCNVFVRHDGVTKFIASLSQQDVSDWVTEGLSSSTARVSPNGAWLAFLSHRALTGYDTRSAATAQPVSEAYLYHAPADLGTEAGTLSCASCDPTDARPAGPASVPAWRDTFGQDFVTEAFYQPRYLSDEGRLFFNSPDALVPLDVSKQSEVFEYEPAGVPAGEHACSSSSSSGSEVFKPAQGEEAAGCVALISTGTAAEGSQFLEASAGAGVGEAGEPGSQGGRDVFFLTTEKVLPQDLDTAPDVYDAHECSPASPCISQAPALLPCTTEASCKAPPTPQPTIYAAPATATFSGPGNPGGREPNQPAVVPKKVTKKAAKCKKGFVKNKKSKCVKHKKKKTKAKKSAHTNRRIHS
jgi:hypothetical protein